MALGFAFALPVDPHNPLDPSDPPPKGWDTVIDTRDYRKALFGFRSDLFAACCEWEKREKERYEDSKSSFYVLRFRSKLKNFAKSLDQYGYVGAYVQFFPHKARVEIWAETVVGLEVLAVVRVVGEMGSPSEAIVISPASLPGPVKKSLERALPELNVRFELCSVNNMRA